MQKLCFDNSSGAFIKARIFHYQQLPIKTIDFGNEKEQKAHNEIVKYVDQLLELNNDLKTTTLQTTIDQTKSKIAYYEDKINDLVYNLYNLTDSEIKTLNE